MSLGPTRMFKEAGQAPQVVAAQLRDNAERMAECGGMARHRLRDRLEQIAPASRVLGDRQHTLDIVSI